MKSFAQSCAYTDCSRAIRAWWNAKSPGRRRPASGSSSRNVNTVFVASPSIVPERQFQKDLVIARRSFNIIVDGTTKQSGCRVHMIVDCIASLAVTIELNNTHTLRFLRQCSGASRLAAEFRTKDDESRGLTKPVHIGATPHATS